MRNTLIRWFRRHRWITLILAGMLILRGLQIGVAFYESPDITSTLKTLDLARQRQDAELAYAQVLPPEHGGHISRTYVQTMIDSNWRYFYELYECTKVRHIEIGPIRTAEGVTLVAVVEVETCFQTTDARTIRSKVVLIKWHGRWLISEFR